MKLLEYAMEFEKSSKLWERAAAGICSRAVRIQADWIEKRLEKKNYYFPDDMLTTKEMLAYIEQHA